MADYVLNNPTQITDANPVIELRNYYYTNGNLRGTTANSVMSDLESL